MPLRSCQDTKMSAFWPPGSSLPGIWVLGIWQCGVILLRARGHLDNLVAFPGVSPTGGNPKNPQKICFVGFVLPHSQNVTKVYYLLYLHHVGMLPKSSTNQHFCIPKSIFWESQCTSWLRGVPLCQYQAAKIPTCQLSCHLVPAYLASWYLVSGCVE